MDYRTVVLTGNDPEKKREEIRRYFHDTYTLHEQLYEMLADDEIFYQRADPLRHPLIFYYGHTAVFFINKLVLAKLIDKRINPEFESIFAIGVDEMSWDDLNDENYDWPTVAETKAYRDEVRQVVDDLISNMPLTLPIDWENPFWPVMMGIEHERIHLETSSVLIRQLPIDRVVQLDKWPVSNESGEAPENELLPVPGREFNLGKPHGHPLYGWDCEYGNLQADVKAFKASKYLVSNQEYLAFVKDGGYSTEKWWTDEGWRWVNYRQLGRPLFWVESGDSYQLRTVASVIDMPWNWPVEVNQLEAAAYCRWLAEKTGKHIRLPTEEEWYALYHHCECRDLPEWGENAPGNINLEYGASSCPVDKFSFNGFYDVIGNVWQWTETPVTGFPGFKVHPLYDDFSVPTFDMKHNLIKGGSWISTGNEATCHARYAFRRHFYQHAGFRYIESDQPVKIRDDVYETDKSLTQYAEFHYGAEYFGVPNFPARCAFICKQLMKDKPRKKALDIGCAAGRLTFELATDFEQVTGLDFSARFIQLAVELMQKGHMKYSLVEEGEIESYHETELKDFALDEVRSKVEFFQADACNLKPVYTGYDLVVANNVIDRLYSPKKFLHTIHERLNAGGLMVITSPYSWSTDHTEREEWLGGFKRDGENLTTFEAMAEILSENFKPVGNPHDIEFVLRETSRKYQHTITQMSVWERK